MALQEPAAIGRGDDGDRLLEGEDPRSAHPEDIAHWIDVYSELLAYKHELLQRSETIASHSPPPARKEIEETDLALLEAEASRFRRRLDFWTRRQREVDGPQEP